MAGSAADIKQECRVLGAGPGRAWFVNSLLYSVTQTFTWVKAGAASLSVVWSRVPFRCVDAPVAPRPFWPSLGVARGCVPWVLRCASHTRRRMSHWDEFLERRLLWAAHTAEGGDFQPASQL